MRPNPKRENMMLTRYINAAMELATYGTMSDGTYFGEIPDFHGVWANADSQPACARELRSVLEDWIVLSLSKNMPVPVLGHLHLDVHKVA